MISPQIPNWVRQNLQASIYCMFQMQLINSGIFGDHLFHLAFNRITQIKGNKLKWTARTRVRGAGWDSEDLKNISQHFEYVGNCISIAVIATIRLMHIAYAYHSLSGEANFASQLEIHQVLKRIGTCHRIAGCQWESGLLAIRCTRWLAPMHWIVLFNKLDGIYVLHLFSIWGLSKHFIEDWQQWTLEARAAVTKPIGINLFVKDGVLA